MKLLFAVLPTVMLVVYGQLISKWRIGHLFATVGSASGTSRMLSYLSDPLILSSYAAALGGSVAWMFVVERQPISIAFPLYIGLTMLSVMVGSVALFGEHLSASRIIAILLIFAGVVLGTRG
jgi:multidrug transporter EmrE-like cation transporter